MRPVITIGILTTVASITIGAASSTAPVHNIEITADVPTITVSPRRPGRTSMQLPSLTYELSVIVECEANWHPESVSISVADSRATLTADQLQTSTRPGLKLLIPSNQIAPLRVEYFCIVGGGDEPGTVRPNTITIPGVMSAQASLRCVTESTKSTMYVSKPLDVILECATPERAAD